jgi:glycosyltransferase involved in cell wall biosynthesis
MTALVTSEPLVSAVIPTHKRSDTLPRAVQSALSQTYCEIEVVVVIDGPDAETTQVLGLINDPRIRIVQLDSNLGGGDARNAGVSAARGEWIAFLDDDDEWLPDKIERQLAMLASVSCDDPIISCRFIARTPSGEYVWPNRFPRPSEPISEYLLVRQGISRVDGFVATPTILTRRSLLRRVPFQSGLKKHQDWDWVLRATSQPGVGLFFCPETLAICHMEANDSTSRQVNWEFSLQWIHANRGRVTARAYASFIATHVGWQAAAQRRWRAFGPLLWDAFHNGSLRPIDVVRYFGFWFVPPAYRHEIKRRYGYGSRHTLGDGQR